MLDKSEGFGLFVLGIIAGTLIIAILGAMLKDGADTVNTRALGEIICEEQGLEYNGREFRTIEHKGNYISTIPTIYCRDKNETKIIDGIVIKE